MFETTKNNVEMHDGWKLDIDNKRCLLYLYIFHAKIVAHVNAISKHVVEE